MNSISDFLGKFSQFQDNQSRIKKTISSIIQNISGMDIPETNIDIIEDRVYLKVHPAILNEILIHKSVVLTEIEKKTKKMYRIIGLS